MKWIQTKKQIEHAKGPTRLEVLRELDKRGALNGEMEADFYKLEMGYSGEQTVVKWLQEFGMGHWHVLQNLWMYKNGNFECDLLLLTRAKIYHFEIKNYTKNFAYEQGQCYFDGEKMSHNAISQAQRVFINFENILKEEQFQVPLESVLVFVGQHCDVSIQDNIQDVVVKTSQQLREYIGQIAIEEKASKGKTLELNRLLQIVEKYELADRPFSAEPITVEMKAKVRSGLTCSHCGSMEVELNKTELTCECKMSEPRENAIVRTICEYGVIHFDKDLVTTDVLAFFGNQISRSTLYDFLNKYFQRRGSYRNTCFTNLTIPIERCYADFNFEKSRSLLIEGY